MHLLVITYLAPYWFEKSCLLFHCAKHCMPISRWENREKLRNWFLMRVHDCLFQVRKARHCATLLPITSTGGGHKCAGQLSSTVCPLNRPNCKIVWLMCKQTIILRQICPSGKQCSFMHFSGSPALIPGNWIISFVTPFYSTFTPKKKITLNSFFGDSDCQSNSNLTKIWSGYGKSLTSLYWWE